MDEDHVAVTDARANLSELLASVRYRDRCVLLTQRGKPRAAVIPPDLGELISEFGGPTEVREILNIWAKDRPQDLRSGPEGHPLHDGT